MVGDTEVTELERKANEMGNAVIIRLISFGLHTGSKINLQVWSVYPAVNKHSSIYVRVMCRSIYSGLYGRQRQHQTTMTE